MDTDLLAGLWAHKSYLGFGVLAVYYAIRIMRMGWFQMLLPQALQWDSLPVEVRQVLVGVASCGGAVVVSLAGGMPVQEALVAALPVALGAVGWHKAVQGVGDAIDMRALKLDPDYQPGTVRKATSIVVPISDGVTK